MHISVTSPKQALLWCNEVNYTFNEEQDFPRRAYHSVFVCRQTPKDRANAEDLPCEDVLPLRAPSTRIIPEQAISVPLGIPFALSYRRLQHFSISSGVVNPLLDVFSIFFIIFQNSVFLVIHLLCPFHFNNITSPVS
jgi:hypothetical protein